MNWPIFLSAAAGVVAGVAVCAFLFWVMFYGGGEMTYKASGWAVGPVTFTDVDDEESERIGLSLFNATSIVMGVSSAKVLVRQLLLLIEDAEKANEEKK